ncbi:MAG: hypothetical protein ACLRIL_09325 [Fusicatenibacter saccharivorans]
MSGISLLDVGGTDRRDPRGVGMAILGRLIMKHGICRMQWTEQVRAIYGIPLASGNQRTGAGAENARRKRGRDLSGEKCVSKIAVKNATMY